MTAELLVRLIDALLFTVRVQQEEHILCVQPRRYQDHLSQWSSRRVERSSASCCNSGAKKVNVVTMLTQTDSVQAREIKLCINKELHFYLNMGRQLDL